MALCLVICGLGCGSDKTTVGADDPNPSKPIPTPVPSSLPSPTPTAQAPGVTSTGALYVGTYAMGVLSLATDACGGQCSPTLASPETFVVSYSGGQYYVTAPNGNTFNATIANDTISFGSAHTTNNAGCDPGTATFFTTIAPFSKTATGTGGFKTQEVCGGSPSTCDCSYSTTGTRS